MFPFLWQTCPKWNSDLGSFSCNPVMFAKQFKYLTQAYKLTWHNVHVVLQSTLTLEEYDRVTSAAQHCDNEAHATDEWDPMGREAIPLQEPLWDYNSPEGEACRDRMVSYLFAGMNSTAQKAINYDKLREITQKPDENPSEFLKHLKETLGAFTKIDPASALGSSLLAMHFITQLPTSGASLKRLRMRVAEPRWQHE